MTDELHNPNNSSCNYDDGPYSERCRCARATSTPEQGDVDLQYAFEALRYIEISTQDAPMKYYIDQRIERLRSYITQHSKSSEVSEGWKLVPVEPTEEMIAHARTATKTANTYVIGQLSNAAARERVLLSAAYSAMIAAAPTYTTEQKSE